MEKESYQIFISYRRDGGEDLATLLEERLTRLGYRVFFDVESLRSGEFNKELLSAIEKCTDFLLVLPVNALDRCINNPDDWVRQEIRHALKHKKNIVPIMKRNFEFPKNLPEDIANISNMNGVAASMEDFNSVINRIVNKFLLSKPNDEDDEYLRKKADDGDISAINELALRYEYGSVSILSNTKKAMELYIYAAENGCAAAIYNLGAIYEKCSENFTLIADYGIEVEQEKMSAEEISHNLLDIAVSYYKQAAETNYPPALYKLGNLYEENKEYREAYAYYYDAAKLNYPPAENAVGFFFQNGIGTEMDLQAAELWYRQAVKSQYAPAIYNYAMLIQSRDPEKALNLFRRVAFGEKALPMATYALGRLYEFCFSDIKNAVECYRLASDAGIVAADTDLYRCKYLF